MKSKNTEKLLIQIIMVLLSVVVGYIQFQQTLILQKISADLTSKPKTMPAAAIPVPPKPDGGRK